jgi:curved DNA-binding protein CbpA
LLRSPLGETYYDVLGVSRTATDDVIRAAFRKAAKAFHPDVNGGNPEAEKRLREVIGAYRSLRSPQKRMVYDQFLAANERASRISESERDKRLIAAPTFAALVSASIVTVAVRLSSELPSTYDTQAGVGLFAVHPREAFDKWSDEAAATVHPEAKLASPAYTGDMIDEREKEGPTHLAEVSIAEKGVETASIASADPIERHAADFIIAQVSSWSSTNAIDFVSASNAYADEVLYYGSVKPLKAVILDKRRLMERWPDRVYQVRSERISVQCAPNLCRVNGLVDWKVHSGPRAASARGLARFDYEIMPTDHAFMIVREESSVVRTVQTRSGR